MQITPQHHPQIKAKQRLQALKQRHDRCTAASPPKQLQALNMHKQCATNADAALT
jgi:hypothetical protein